MGQRDLLADSKIYMRSMALNGFRTLIEKHGGDAEALLDEVGLSRALLTNTNLLYSYQTHIDLWELAASRVGEPNLGLKFAVHSSPIFPNFGPMTVMAQFESTSGNWIKSIERNLKYHSNALQLTTIPIEGTGDISIRLVTDPIVRRGRQVSESDAALVLLMSRAVLKSPLIESKVVKLPHSRPPNTDFHKEIFGTSIEFNSPFLEAVVSERALSIPIRSSMQVLRPVVHWFAKKIVNSSASRDVSVSQEVRMAISLHLGTKRLNITDIARTLERHPKQLQRELAEEGCNFSEVLDESRKNIARRLLRDSQISIATLAGYLDYSSSSSFLLAFKRWEGISALQFRKSSSRQS